jgi:D-sedoheptulose 7-phosphate isomerase
MRYISSQLDLIKNNVELINNKDIIDEIHNISLYSARILKKNKKIIFCGNGGSAADSNHLSAELVGRFLKKRKALNAISLTANTSAITAISNDFGYSEVFVRQIEANCARGDLLFLITTSGKSLNILKALKMAQTMGVKTVLLSSILAKNLRFKSDFKILVPASRTDRIQELHIIIGHLICEQIEKLILK